MAHQTAGGPYTGGASYDYEVGPDGKRYAVAGEVPIDYGPVPGDPQATVEKMQTVIAAAMHQLIHRQRICKLPLKHGSTYSKQS